MLTLNMTLGRHKGCASSSVSVPLGALTAKRGREVGTDSFRSFGPLLLGALQHGLAVFGQDPALLHQIVHCACVSSDVVFAGGISFGEGFARIACFLTLN